MGSGSSKPRQRDSTSEGGLSGSTQVDSPPCSSVTVTPDRVQSPQSEIDTGANAVGVDSGVAVVLGGSGLESKSPVASRVSSPSSAGAPVTVSNWAGKDPSDGMSTCEEEPSSSPLHLKAPPTRERTASRRRVRLVVDEEPTVTAVSGDGVDRKGVFALARNHNWDEIVTMLEDGRCPIDIVDSVGRSLLHYAAESDQRGAAVELLRRGISVDLQDHSGDTALHICYRHGYSEFGRLLEVKGADVHASNVLGCKPLDLKEMSVPQSAASTWYGDDMEAQEGSSRGGISSAGLGLQEEEPKEESIEVTRLLDVFLRLLSQLDNSSGDLDPLALLKEVSEACKLFSLATRRLGKMGVGHLHSTLGKTRQELFLRLGDLLVRRGSMEAAAELVWSSLQVAREMGGVSQLRTQSKAARILSAMRKKTPSVEAKTSMATIEARSNTNEQHTVQFEHVACRNVLRVCLIINHSCPLPWFGHFRSKVRGLGGDVLLRKCCGFNQNSKPADLLTVTSLLDDLVFAEEGESVSATIYIKQNDKHGGLVLPNKIGEVLFGEILQHSSYRDACLLSEWYRPHVSVNGQWFELVHTHEMIPNVRSRHSVLRQAALMLARKIREELLKILDFACVAIAKGAHAHLKSVTPVVDFQYDDSGLHESLSEIEFILEQTSAKLHLSTLSAEESIAFESAVHERILRDIVCTPYSERADIEGQIRCYFEQLTGQEGKALILVGLPGVGKTACLAHACEFIIPSVLSTAKLIVRFCGMTSKSANCHSVLYSVCCDLALLAHLNISEVPVSLKDLIADFPRFLRSAAELHPVVIVLDGLDELLDTTFQWITIPLPPKCFMLVSTDAEANGVKYGSLLRAVLPDTCFVNVTRPRTEQCLTICHQWLKTLGCVPRTDRDDLLRITCKMAVSPLIVVLSLRAVAQLRRFDRVRPIPSSLAGVVGHICDEIEYTCGKIFVSIAFGLLLCSREGLSEVELSDLVSCNDECLAEVADTLDLEGVLRTIGSSHASTVTSVLRFPDIIVSRFLYYSKSLMKKRYSAGFCTYAIINEQVRESLSQRYAADDASSRLHEALADYFVGRWASGKPWASGGDSGSTVLRGCPDQPCMFSKSKANMRKVIELPYHLRLSRDWKRFDTYICTSEFLSCACNNGELSRLVWDFQLSSEEEQVHLSIQEMARFLRSRQHILERQPDALFSLMVSWPDATAPQVIAVRDVDKEEKQPAFLHWSKSKSVDPVLLVLYGHSAPVLGVCFSPASTRLISSSADGSVRVWDTRAGLEICQCVGHTMRVWCAVSVPYDPSDPAWDILSCSDDGSLRLWDGASGNIKLILNGHEGPVYSCSMSKDGRVAVSAGRDGARLWPRMREKNPSLVQVPLEGHSGPVLCCAFSPSTATSLAVTGGRDGTLRVWNGGDGRLVAVGWDHEWWIRDCAFSFDGSFIATASGDCSVRVWDAESRLPNAPGTTVPQLRCVATMNGHKEWVLSVAFPHARKDVVASGGCDSTVRLWNVSGGQQIKLFSAHRDWVQHLSFSPDDAILASSSDDRCIVLWSTDWSDLPLGDGDTSSSIVAGCAVAHSGRLAVSVFLDGRATLWSMPSFSKSGLLTVPARVTSCTFSRDDRMIAFGCLDDCVRVYSVRRNVLVRILKLEGMIENGVLAVSFSPRWMEEPDGAHTQSASSNRCLPLLASASGGGRVMFWDVHSTLTTSHAYIITKHEGPAVTLSWSSLRDIALSGGKDGCIMVWSVPYGICLVRVALNAEIRSLNWSIDNCIACVGSGDGRVFLLDPDAWVILGEFSLHSEAVSRVSLHDQLLVTASEDHTVTCGLLQGHRSRKEPCRFDVGGPITSAEVLPLDSGGVTIVVGTWDGTVDAFIAAEPRVLVELHEAGKD